jgi:hypothetical protein
MTSAEVEAMKQTLLTDMGAVIKEWDEKNWRHKRIWLVFVRTSMDPTYTE